MPAPTPVAESIRVPPKFPGLPREVLVRFPSLVTWEEEDVKRWNTRLVQSLEQQNRSVATTVAQTQNDTRTLRVSFGNFSAAITEEVDAIADEQGAQARRIVTVSAMAGVNSNITVQTTPPTGPALNDYWIDNSDITLPITYQWNGASWVEVEEPIAFAGVADERTARVTADGFLEGKYTLTVVAGDVITGFNITSASGSGTNVSNVAWTADQFQIYSGTAKKVMFYADGVQNKVRLANVLTVDGTAGSIYVKTTAGAGSWADPNTPFFVDEDGFFSLKDRLYWNSATNELVVIGTIINGAVGGDYVIIDGSGLMVGANTSTATVHINNNAGVPYLNFRYNGNVFGSWSVNSTRSIIQLTNSAGTTAITIDPAVGGGITMIGALTYAGDGSLLSNLNASFISTGTLGNARLPSAISVTTLASSGAGSFGSIQVGGTEIVTSGRIMNSVGVNFDDTSGVKCNFQANTVAGADSVFANYMRIFMNGGTAYVPYRTTAP